MGLLKNLISPVVMAVRVILRDSGILFDVTDADTLPDSLRQYVVARMMVAHDKKAYLTTTGYNRIELFFRLFSSAARRPDTSGHRKSSR